MLPISPFPSRALAALNAVAEALLLPAAFALNQLLDLQPTTAERRRRPRCLDACRRAALGSVLAALLLLAMPLAALGLLLWLPLQATRRQFAYSFWASAEAAAPWDGRQSRDFTFVTANVCLLPSGLAKFSNLGRTEQRAKYLARCLAPDGATDRQPLVGVTVEIPRDPKEGIWATPTEPPMGAPKEDVWITPTEPSKDGQRDAVIDVPRDGVKDTPWDPTTTDTPWGGVKDTPKDPMLETPKDPTAHAPGVGVCVTPKDPTPRDGDTPWDELRVTPMDNDTLWDPTGATPKHRDPPWDPTKVTPMDNDTLWDPTGATPLLGDPQRDPTRATPKHRDPPWDPTRTTPKHWDPQRDPTRTTPKHWDPQRDPTRTTPKHWDPQRNPTRTTPKHWDPQRDPTRATPKHWDPQRDPTRTTPKHWDPQRDPTRTTPMLGATPMDDDTPRDPTGATPRPKDPSTPPPPPHTWLGSSPQLWERFPPAADFVCLQEVFDPMAEALLCRQLGLRYPHVLHGVGAGGLRAGGLKVLGSGLLVASRYPVTAASFYCYPNGAGEDALAAKGLLCIQVELGRVSGCRLLGFVSCTHLQAPEGDAAIRSEQLRLALRWVQHFQETHSNRGDVVGFDVLCGDLNFDNCSRVEGCNQQHSLFRRYRDPCRLGLRREAPWAMGTLLDYLKLHDDPISSPERMRRTLSDPEGRRRFLAGPLVCGPKRDPNPDPKRDPDPDGDPSADPDPTEWHGRRVDYILYREGGTELSTEVSALGFVTALAARSDHLPVALTLSVSPTTAGGPDPQVPPPILRPPAAPPNYDPQMPPKVPKWPQMAP